MLAEKGLKGELSEEKASHTTVAKDAIAIQDPSEGVPVKEGSIVKLTLSAGPDMVEVPDLKGYTRQEAVVALTNLGLVLSEDIQEMHHDYILKGSIISQEPEANEQVRPNTEVSVVISKGPVVQLYKVQSFVGMPLEEAVAAAQALGIEFGTIGSEMSWTHGKDVIIRQSPVGDTEVPVGTKVDLVISSGPGPEGNQ